MITYAKEKIADIKSEINPLVQDNYDEVEIDTDKLKLDLNWNAYDTLENIDMLHIYTARDQKKLVGYFVLITNPSLHCAGETQACSDVIYIHPKSRKGKVGTWLIEFAEKDLKDKGISTMHITTKTHAPFDKILERGGYTFAEKVFQKYIGDK